MSAVVNDTATKDSNPKNLSFVKNDFGFNFILGKGGVGKVFSCLHKKEKKRVAIKVIQKADVNTKLKRHQLHQEIELHYHLRHKNIVTMFAFFEEPETVFIVLELCGMGTLFKAFSSRGHLSLARSSYIVDRIADALEYCHSRGVVHRDVKPENILINGLQEPKLADFGWAIFIVKPVRFAVGGTSDYLSPEVLDSGKKPFHNHKVDNWALGVLFYECLTGETPFYNVNQETMYKDIRAGLIQSNKRINKSTMELIRKLLTVNVEKRLELSALRSDEYFRKLVDSSPTL